jgi:hypothetical protein
VLYMHACMHSCNGILHKCIACRHLVLLLCSRHQGLHTAAFILRWLLRHTAQHQSLITKGLHCLLAVLSVSTFETVMALG